MTHSFSSVPTSLPKAVCHNRTERRAVEQLRLEYHSLHAEIEQIRRELQTAEENFNILTEPSAIDTCIYRIRATQCRHNTLCSRLDQVRHRLENLTREPNP